MMSSLNPKKKKTIDREEEERMKALLQKPVDVNTLSNERLRPWTVNPSSEGVLRTELGKLDKTIVITSPQMSAGDKGFSVLDRKLPEIEAFKDSLKTRAKLNPYKSVYEDYIIQYQSKFQKLNNLPRNSGNRSKNGENSDNQINDNSRTTNDAKNGEFDSSSNMFQNSTKYLSKTSTPGSEDLISEVDIDHVERIQRMISSKSQTLQHHIKVPLPTVHYRPFKSPAVFPVSTSEYQKMRQEMQAFPKPATASIHLNHRNQMLMMSIVGNHFPEHGRQRRNRRTRHLQAIKSNPEINSSYYHVPPPGSS